MKRVRVAIGLLQRQGRYFAQRRDLAASHLPGLWEFPGGKLEALETPLAGLLRELREEIQCVPEAVAALPVIRHRYPELEVELHPFLCHGGGPPRTGLSWGWFSALELARLALPEGDRELVESLKDRPLGLLRR